MKITNPSRYKVSFDSKAFTIECDKGSKNFSGIATSSKPKLYIVSVNEMPIYVGVTKQSMRSRLRTGWSSNGKNGYHGYAWRHKFTEAYLDIWCHEDAPAQNSNLDFETVEAEVVYLIRCAGQWPTCQTEIHFHPSTTEHRAFAKLVVSRYKP